MVTHFANNLFPNGQLYMKKSPVSCEKSPIYREKSPICGKKSPICSKKSIQHREMCQKDVLYMKRALLCVEEEPCCMALFALYMALFMHSRTLFTCREGHFTFHHT